MKFHQYSVVAFYSLSAREVATGRFGKQRIKAAGCQYAINLFSFATLGFINITEEEPGDQS